MEKGCVPFGAVIISWESLTSSTEGMFLSEIVMRFNAM